MTQRTGYPDGAPCWADLNTPDLDGARRFYSGVLGWTFDEPVAEFGHYTTARLQGRSVVGVAPKMPDQQHLPSAWSVYLKTSDIEATVRKMADAGGNVFVPPMEIPGQGHMAFGFDSTGAAFGLWQPASHTGAQAFDEPGAMCWHEVNTREGEKADAFYRRLFPYEQQQIGDCKTFDYVVYHLEGTAVGGRMQMNAEWEGIPPHWMTYFRVEDTDPAAERVRQFGGKVMHGPFDSPHGRIAVVSDPYGAIFSIIGPAPTPAS
ncbi:VOC family protein [Nannocystis radixulma]|uniref:VOC family protein n=1 Tax=Nannocystis radixulma TaxID=2995305 RepID=A0ABT5AZP7_9BACT|nr:VOC family protein [Nannocystis radixulma]MDC0666764.1 VOC family protein [Nannocystis radixulma]